jgi:glycosyltransferase involved in cell wall biosynthesis
LRILQIGSSLYDWGGIERYVAYLAEGLLERGHEVHVACPCSSPLAQRSPGEKIAIPLRFQFSYWLLPKFARMLRRGDYDVAHVHFSPDFVVPLLAARMARVPRVVMTRHVALPWSQTKVRRYESKVHRIVCVSDAVRRALSESGVPEDKLVVAKAGCPAPEPGPGAAALREKLTEDSEGLAVGYFGRLVSDKGVQHLVEAAKSFPAGARLHVFGEGPLRAELEAAADGLPVAFHGFVPDVADALAAMDAVAIPSVWAEAFPFAALEAMALAKPIVATRKGGLPEMVEDGKTGLLVPAESAAALAGAVAALCSDREWAKAMGRMAQERHRQEFTLSKFAERMEAVYESI